MTPDERWANQRTGHAGATQPLLEDSDPTSSRRTAVYPPSRIVSKPAANENLPFHLGLELGGFPGLYKPAVPDQQQDTTARTLRVKNSGSGISSPPYLQPYTKPFSEAGGALRPRSGIVYPFAATRPTPRHQRRRRCRPSRASCCPTPGSAAYDSGDWKHQPATDTPCCKETHFQEALQKTPTQPLYRGIPAVQALTTPWALV